MLLSDARLRVRKLVDDVDELVYDDTEVADAIGAAQAEVWHAALASAPNVFNVTGSFSSSSAGVVDLTSVQPQRIVTVSTILNGVRTTVSPMRQDEAPTSYSQVQALSVLYVPDVAFPASDAAAFVWGHASVAASTVAILEAAMVAAAALDLKPKENEVLAGLEQRKAEKMKLIADLRSIPGWTVTSMNGLTRGRRAPFGYIVTSPHTLQLVR